MVSQSSVFQKAAPWGWERRVRRQAEMALEVLLGPYWLRHIPIRFLAARSPLGMPQSWLGPSKDLREEASTGSQQRWE